MDLPRLERYSVSGASDRLYINGDVQQSLKLNADGFFNALLALPPPRCLDLLRIAAGVYVVDRISKRKRSSSNEYGVRRLHLVFSVRDLGFWERSDITQLLLEILSFLTGDDWSFGFSNDQRIPGDLGHQNFLTLPRPFQPRFAGLYSGGLDSAAGLANRFVAEANDFLLVTVGHQSGLHNRVAGQLRGLRKVLGSTRRYLHSTLTLSLLGGKSKRLRSQEQTQRSRALLFCTSAAIAAREYGLDVIEVFENGVGAINLPLMTGMLGSGLATRGAHPTFLQLMSQLASEVTGTSIRFVLPFEGKTKAEMIQGLKGIDLQGWLQGSRSCVHTSLRQLGKTHCGRCASCIERRQAFAIAGINENVQVYQTDVLSEVLSDLEERDYFDLYRWEAKKWTDGDEDVRRRMRNHLRLTDVLQQRDREVGELQIRHSKEVLRVFGPPFSRGRESMSLVTSNAAVWGN